MVTIVDTTNQTRVCVRLVNGAAQQLKTMSSLVPDNSIAYHHIINSMKSHHLKWKSHSFLSCWTVALQLFWFLTIVYNNSFLGIQAIPEKKPNNFSTPNAHICHANHLKSVCRRRQLRSLISRGYIHNMWCNWIGGASRDYEFQGLKARVSASASALRWGGLGLLEWINFFFRGRTTDNVVWRGGYLQKISTHIPISLLSIFS